MLRFLDPVPPTLSVRSYFRTAAAALFPLTTAPSIVAGNPVSIQSPARNSPSIGVRVPGRCGCPGASENVACFSRITVARIGQTPRAPGSEASTYFAARSASASLV